MAVVHIRHNLADSLRQVALPVLFDIRHYDPRFESFTL
jgi:hypothetical protein